MYFEESFKDIFSVFHAVLVNPRSVFSQVIESIEPTLLHELLARSWVFGFATTGAVSTTNADGESHS